VCLGISGKMLDLWFGETHASRSFSIRAHLKAIDAEMRKLKPPAFIGKPPKSLKKFGKWKGAEHRTWILYYSVILLQGKLSNERYRHWCYFVIGISLLLGPSISPSHLAIAAQCFTLFYSEFATHYGLRWASINLHHIKHLVTLVKKFGPLWSVSCFGFESYNHFLRGLIHGTGSVLSQLTCSSFIIRKSVRTIESYVNLADAKTFLKKLDAGTNSGFYEMPRPRSKYVYQIREGIFMVGMSFKTDVPIAIKNCAVQALINVEGGNDKVIFFRRGFLTNTDIHGTSYVKTKSKNSAVVAYRNQDGKSILG